MTTTSFQVPEVARPSPETVFAELLADVLRVDRVSVDSHFFDELGADSLVMAKFCARVRKRGDLPSVSMQDIYRHPTIWYLFQRSASCSWKTPAHSTLPLETRI